MSARAKGLVFGIYFFSLLGSLIIVDALIALYADNVLGQGRLFAFDSEVGWKGIPGIKRDRRRGDGGNWHVEINTDGYRGRSQWKEHAEKRILILGDSFAFGEGIDEKDRFDTIIDRENPTWSTVNRGMSGFGTDQAMISGRSVQPSLKKGDAVILLTYMNDFYDILRTSFVGRQKPWYSYEQGILFLHPVKHSFASVFRERSYIVSRILTALEKPQEDYSREELKRGINLYKKIIEQEFIPYRQQGVRAIIIFHGMSEIIKHLGSNSSELETMIASVCSYELISCLDFDTEMNQINGETEFFFPGGHWNKAGNKFLAALLKRELDVLFSSK